MNRLKGFRVSERPEAIIACTLIIAFAMCLFPPWRTPVPGQGFSVNVGYHLILSPPNPIAEVDLGRLLAQLFLVLAVAGGAILASNWSARRQ